MARATEASDNSELSTGTRISRYILLQSCVLFTPHDALSPDHYWSRRYCRAGPVLDCLTSIATDLVQREVCRGQWAFWGFPQPVSYDTQSVPNSGCLKEAFRRRERL